MRFTTRRRVAAGLAVLAWIGIAAVLLRPKRDRVSEEDATPDAVPAGAAPPPAVPGLEASRVRAPVRDASPAAPAATPASPAAGETAGDTLRVFGTVAFPEDVEGGGLRAEVAVFRAAEDPVARIEIDARRRSEYEVVVPRGAAKSVAVRVLCPGFGKLTSWADAPGGEVRVDLAYRGDARIRAQVVDPHGRPLKSLPLILAGQTMWGSEGKRWDPDGTIVADPDSTAHRGSARTDDDGVFEVRGFPDGTSLGIGSLDPAWTFPTTTKVASRASSAAPPPQIVALPAFLTEFVLVDVATGDLLNGRHQGRLRASRGSVVFDGIGFSAAVPKIRWWRPLPEPIDAPFHVTLDLEVDGYREVAHTFEFDGLERRRTVTVPFTRRTDAEYGVLVLDLGAAGGAGPAHGPTVMRYKTADGGRSGYSLRAEARADGRWGVRLPGGGHELEVTPAHAVPFRGSLQWSGTLEVPAGRETPFVVPWPPHGSLRIRVGYVRPVLPKLASLRLVSAEGVTHDTFEGEIQNGEVFAPAVPVGEWTLRVLDPSDVPEQKVTIREGAETVVELRK